MRPLRLSVRSYLLAAIAVMGVVALLLVYFSAQTYRQTLQRELQAAAEARLAVDASSEFASHDARLIAQAAPLVSKLASADGRRTISTPWVAAMLADLVQDQGLRAAMYLDQDRRVVTTAGDAVGTAGCTALPSLGARPPSDPVRGVFCLIEAGIQRVAFAELQTTGRPIGYLKLISDGQPLLNALERRVGYPLELLAADGQVLHRSPRWRTPPQAVEHVVALTGTIQNVARLRIANPRVLPSAALDEAEAGLFQRAVLVVAAIAAALGALLLVMITRPLDRLRAFLRQLQEHGPQSARLVGVPGAADLQEVAICLKDLAGEYNRLFDSLAGKALTDPVTGLANRPRFLDLLRRAIDSAQRDFKPFALLLMDLDQFKEINDTLGHHSGDVLLREVAERLQPRLRDSDILARLGGDEFAILLPGVNDKDALIAARMLLQTLRAPFSIAGHVLDVNASLGIAVYPDHGVDAETLVKRADVAMYHAKDKNRGYAFYEDGMDPHSPTHLLLLTQLRHALDNEEFTLVYQPKVNLRDNVISGVEALARWQHPSGSLYLPDTFIPLLERNGLIRNLTEWLLREAFATCHRLHEAGHMLNVSVNLSVRDLQNPYFIDVVAEQLAANHIDPQWIVLEITESAVMTDPEHAIRILQRLAGMGFTLAIDDFGTGYSSLAYLKKLPVREVKIDKTFVLNMAHDINDAAIVRTSIELARNLKLAVVAEGVESGEILARLRELTCDAAQGMYISRPLTAAELDEWLVKSVWAQPRQEADASQAAVPPRRQWH